MPVCSRAYGRSEAVKARARLLHFVPAFGDSLGPAAVPHTQTGNWAGQEAR